MDKKENDSIDHFGAIIKRERKAQKLSLSKLSAMTKPGDDKEVIAPSYINRLESNINSNPSFKVVCELASALSLDLREVYKVFGYEDLLSGDDFKTGSTIEELIRLNDLTAPTPISGNLDYRVEGLLRQSEKEQLIAIINSIFNFSVSSPGQSLKQLPNVIDQIMELREMRLERFQNRFTDDNY